MGSWMPNGNEMRRRDCTPPHETVLIRQQYGVCTTSRKYLVLVVGALSTLTGVVIQRINYSIAIRLNRQKDTL
jgi:hypothetical protein